MIVNTCTLIHRLDMQALDCGYYDVIESKRFIHYDVIDIDSVTLLLVIFSDMQYTCAICIFWNNMQLYL
jgi:hypothetical protein